MTKNFLSSIKESMNELGFRNTQLTSGKDAFGTSKKIVLGLNPSPDKPILLEFQSGVGPFVTGGYLGSGNMGFLCDPLEPSVKKVSDQLRKDLIIVRTKSSNPPSKGSACDLTVKNGNIYGDCVASYNYDPRSKTKETAKKFVNDVHTLSNEMYDKVLETLGKKCKKVMVLDYKNV